MENQKLNHNVPVTRVAMSFLIVLAAPLVLIIVFIVWPDSIARQLAAAGAMTCLVALILFRQIFQALLLALVFISQFSLSLHSFPLAPPAQLQVFFVDLVIAALIMVAIERRIRFRLDAVGWVFFILLVWFAFTTFNSVHPQRSLIFLISQFKYLLIYCLALNAAPHERFSGRLATVVSVVLIFQALLGVVQTLKGGPLGLHILGEFSGENLQNLLVAGSLRAGGTIGGSNGYAGYLAMLLVFLFPFLLRRRSFLRDGGFAIGMMALILALSRAGWLSFMIGVFCVVFMMLRLRLVRLSRLLIFSVVGCLVLAVCISAYYDKIMHRFQDRNAIQAATGRITQIVDALKVIEKHPITGIGPGIAEFFGRWNNNLKYIKKSLPGVHMANMVHSGQLQIAIESGIPGLALFLLLTALLVSAVFRKVRIDPDDDTLALVRIGGTCAAVAVMVHISFGTEFNNQQLFVGFWTLLGFARSHNAPSANQGFAEISLQADTMRCA
jgi:O-antigen ligase